MATKTSLVEVKHDTGYGDDLVWHMNNAFNGRDMIAQRVITSVTSTAANMQAELQGVPALDELLKKLSNTDVPFFASATELYRRVASGERHPTEPALPDNFVILACQAMYVLINHAEKK